MNGSSSNGPKHNSRNGQVEISPLVDMLDEQDEAVRTLFAKALNLFLSPGAEQSSESEKIDRLKKAVEESLR